MMLARSASCTLGPGRGRAANSWRLLRAHAAASPEIACAHLRTWLQQHGGDASLTSVAGEPGREQVCCSGPVQPGQPLLTIPRQLLMTEKSAKASKHCGELVEAAGLTEWQALVLHVLCERADPGSFWAPYLQLLAGDPALAHHPLLWTAPQRGMLQGSPMLPRLEARLQQIEEDTAALVAAGANSLPLAGQGPLVTTATVAWAAAVLLSRAFSLDMSDEEGGGSGDGGGGGWQQQGDVLALVPWADLADLTAGQEGPCLEYDPDRHAAVLVAERAYTAGDAVQIACGAGLSASDMLLDWGYVLPGAAGRYDAAPEQIAPPRGSRNQQLLAALGQLQGAGAQIALGDAGPDVTSLTWVRAALSSDADLVRAGWRLTGAAAAGPGAVDAACRVMGKLSFPTSPSAEAAVLSAFDSFIGSRLSSYAGGPAGAADAPGGMQQQVAAAWASEAAALQGAQAVIQDWQQQLAAGCGMEALAEAYSGGFEEEGEWEDDG